MEGRVPAGAMATPARTFASDNNSGVHPAVLDALARANVGHARAYGDDPLTRRVRERLRALLGPRAHPFLVFNGTGANVLGLAALTRPYHAVLCAKGAHVAVDECSAPERFAGLKLVEVPTPDGKLTPALLEPHLEGLGFEHHAQPHVVSVTQATEVGTVYSPAEVRALADWAHARGLRLHVDGARLANAAVAIADAAGIEPAEALRACTADAGVDVLSFGGTKNGLMGAEAVVLFDDALAPEFPFLRKQGMQLASKMRFLAAQMDAYLADDLWVRNARQANGMARLLADEAAKVPGVELAFRVEANEVFARIPREAVKPLQDECFFYEWPGEPGLVRWVCSFDTAEEDVRAFVAAMRRVLKR